MTKSKPSQPNKQKTTKAGSQEEENVGAVQSVNKRWVEGACHRYRSDEQTQTVLQTRSPSLP